MNRRMFLRSAAATVWLPTLVSALPRSAWGQTATAPRRLAYWFVPNGLQYRALIPGASSQADVVLSPMQPMAGRVSQVSGLRNLTTREYSSHEEATSSLLSDQPINYRGGGAVRAGMSVDQLVAEGIGNQTPIPSLALGASEAAFFTSGNSAIYTNNISWARENRPNTKITDPRRVFHKMFAGADPVATEENQALRKSVLDAVLERAKTMRSRLAYDDKQKLDQYIDSVRDVERQISSIEQFTCPIVAEPSAVVFHDVYRAMADLMILAFQCDYTRVVTFMTGPSVDYTVYAHLNISTDHHSLSHATTNGGIDDFMSIHRWHVEQMRITMERMAAIPEGDGDLLSNTALTLLAEFGDPNVHNPHVMTWLLGGGESAGFKHGRHLPANAPHSNYHRAMLQFMGLGSERFGRNSTGVLDLT